MDIFVEVPLSNQHHYETNNSININSISNNNSSNTNSSTSKERKTNSNSSTPILISNNSGINLGLNNYQQNFHYLIPNGASNAGSTLTSPYIKSSIQNKNSPKFNLINTPTLLPTINNNNNNITSNNSSSNIKPNDNFNLNENNNINYNHNNISSNNNNSNINNSNNSNNHNSSSNNNNEALKLINDIDNILYNNNKDNQSKQQYNQDSEKSNIKKIINHVFSRPSAVFFRLFNSYFDKRHQSPSTIKNSELGSAPLKDSLIVSLNNNNNSSNIEIEFSPTYNSNSNNNITINSNGSNGINLTTSTPVNPSSPNLKPNIILYTSYVVILYLIYGILQELLFKKQEVNFFALYSFSQFFFSFLFSIRDIIIQQRNSNKLNNSNNNNNSLNSSNSSLSHLQIFQRLSIKKIKLYTLLSFVLFLTKTLGNESLRLLSYKTKILFQTSKIIPVMIIGGFLFKRSHTNTEYASIAAMLTGLFLFTLGDSVGSALSPLGIILIISYIFVESIKSILYEKILKDFSSELELSLFTNFFGSILTLPILFYSGELKSSLLYLVSHKLVLLSMLGFISLGYFANIAYLNLIKITDAFYANVISSFRKFLTILLSFFLFKDTMLSFHLIGIIIFFIGLGVEIRQQKLKDQKLKL